MHLYKNDYDTLCRIITDYEGNGVEDENVIGNIDIVKSYLKEITDSPDVNDFAAVTINDVISGGNEDDIYTMAVRCQTYWDSLLK